MENKLEKIGQNNFMDNFVKTDDILKDMCGIIESSQKAAYRAVNTTLIQRNWLLGYRIASEELQGEDRAKYGAEIIKKLAKELSAEYGKGYTKSNLYSFYSFYKTSFQFAKILDGAWKGICFCGKATAYSYGEAGLLYRPCVLQLHTEMLCPHRLENREENLTR